MFEAEELVRPVGSISIAPPPAVMVPGFLPGGRGNRLACRFLLVVSARLRQFKAGVALEVFHDRGQVFLGRAS